ncbi:MAG: Uncharacterised protein [Cryomorphaceae bacterium]|nr:MAG: Uncharacterised protein [Cryomorphaceae bacterium]
MGFATDASSGTIETPPLNEPTHNSLSSAVML